MSARMYKVVRFSAQLPEPPLLDGPASIEFISVELGNVNELILTALVPEPASEIPRKYEVIIASVGDKLELDRGEYIGSIRLHSTEPQLHIFVKTIY